MAYACPGCEWAAIPRHESACAHIRAHEAAFSKRLTSPIPKAVADARTKLAAVRRMHDDLRARDECSCWAEA